MSELQGQPGELRFTLEIKRAATGKTETVEMVGHADSEKLAEILRNSEVTQKQED